MSSETLIVIPTDLEARGLGRLAATACLCGFGPVAAAARTTTLLAERAPRRVLLVGIAGTYDEIAWPVGSACAFSAVAIDGIGAGQGDGYRSAGELGFPHWPGDPTAGQARIGDRLPLAGASADDGLLVTVCAAADRDAARARRERFPDAVAEDMEGFGVALACALAGIPLAIVRGMSNVAGERSPTGWRVGAALEAAGRLAATMLAARSPWGVE